ncbi:serine/threonine protein phosphatase [Ralstonia solanacearum]|nr:serine/threonine protein phosphatase [Ralstonia solanacearum]
MSDFPKQGPMTLAEVDEAARIVSIHLHSAFEEIAAKELHPAAAAQAGVQMCLRAYADLLGDDEEAIRQTRRFLDQWESDIPNADSGTPH